MKNKKVIKILFARFSKTSLKTFCVPYIQILFHLKHPFFSLKLNLSNILGLKSDITYFVIT